MKISRKSDTISSGRKKLSTFGKGVIVLGITLIAAIIVIIVVTVNNSKAKNEKLNDLNNAINYAIQTCKNSVGGNTDAMAEIERLEGEIERTKKIDEKTELAQEAIRYTLSITTDTKATDELNGSKNRINVAYRNLGGVK